MVDVASAVFKDAYGCWGFLDLWLREPLLPDQNGLLSSVLVEVTAALRAAQAPVLVGGGKLALPRGLRVDLELLDHRRFDNNGVIYVRHAVR